MRSRDLICDRQTGAFEVLAGLLISPPTRLPWRRDEISRRARRLRVGTWREQSVLVMPDVCRPDRRGRATRARGARRYLSGPRSPVRSHVTPAAVQAQALEEGIDPELVTARGDELRAQHEAPTAALAKLAPAEAQAGRRRRALGAPQPHPRPQPSPSATRPQDASRSRLPSRRPSLSPGGREAPRGAGPSGHCQRDSGAGSEPATFGLR